MFGSNFAYNSVSGKKKKDNGDIDADKDLDIVGNKADFIESLVAEVNADSIAWLRRLTQTR